MAYGYAKLLNSNGYDARVLCHDIKHLMSQPEWDDIDLDPSDFPDENDFFNNSADLSNYRRPDWFLQGTVSQVDQISVILSAGAPPSSPWSRTVGSTLDIVSKGLPYLPRQIRSQLKHLLSRLLTHTADGKNASRLVSSTESLIEAHVHEVHEYLDQNGLMQIDRLEVSNYAPYARFLSRYVRSDEVIFSYASAPISAMLLRKNPYVAVELGTIRDLPFEPTSWGQMIRAGYLLADHVLITNPDNSSAAARLGIDRYSFCPHPVDEAVFVPADGENQFRKELLLRYNTKHLFLAPARQNWPLKGNDLMLGGFATAVRRGLDGHLLIPSWGPDIEKGKRLSRELGVSERIHWISPMSERGLVRYYQAVDAVLDQFILGVFGLITPKAMACGKPVLCAYDEATNQWCFPQRPPVLDCSTIEQIGERLLGFLKLPDQMKDLGLEARKWVLNHHSSRSCISAMTEAGGWAQARYEQRRHDNNSHPEANG